MWYSSILFILVNKVPVLSKDIFLVIFIFSNTPLFFIKIPLFVARFKMIAITEGTAKPRAHGHEATNTPIPLYTIQHIPQIYSMWTKLAFIKIAHTAIVKRLKSMTDLTNTLAIDLQTAWIPSALSSSWFWENLIWVPISTSIDF